MQIWWMHWSNIKKVGKKEPIISVTSRKKDIYFIFQGLSRDWQKNTLNLRV